MVKKRDKKAAGQGNRGNQGEPRRGPPLEGKNQVLAEGMASRKWGVPTWKGGQMPEKEGGGGGAKKVERYSTIVVLVKTQRHQGTEKK